MSTFVYIYPEAGEQTVEANVRDASIRFRAANGATTAILQFPSVDTVTVDICDRLISAVMDIRATAARREVQRQLDKERDERNLAALGFVGPATGGGWAGQHDDPSQHDKEAGHDSSVGG